MTPARLHARRAYILQTIINHIRYKLKTVVMIMIYSRCKTFSVRLVKVYLTKVLKLQQNNHIYAYGKRLK